MLCSVFVSVLLLYTTGGAVVDNQKKGCGSAREEWREFGLVCQPTCDLLGEELCCEVRFVKGCFCIDSHIRDHNGKCVPMAECPIPGVLTFDAAQVTVLEGAKLASLLVSRLNGSRGTVTVRWRVVTPGPYSGLSGLLKFEDGVLEQSINIQLRDNDVKDPDVLVTLELFEPSKKTSIIRERMKLVIKDDDMRPGYPEMAKVGVSVVESDGTAVIQVIRVDGSDGDLHVQWRVVGVSAKVGEDFLNPSSGHLLFTEGETEKQIVVQIVDDDMREGREDFRVELFDPKVAPGALNFRSKGTRMTTVVHIEDDDMKPGYPEMARKEISVTETNGRISILVVRRDGADGEITVRWRVAPGTAVPLQDYRPPVPEEGLLIFKENVIEQTISIGLVDDDVKEKKETFHVELFDPRPGPGVIKFRARGSPMKTDVIIIDDDMTPGVLELERSRYVVSERVEALRVSVVRVGGEDGEVRVHWRTAIDGEAAIKSRAEPGRDFVAGGGELVFKDGDLKKSILVHIVDDADMESEEGFVVELYNPKPGQGTKGFMGLGAVKKTTIVIHDDDMQPGLLQVESSSVEVLESAGTVQLVVVRTEGSDGEVRVHWETTAGTGSTGFFVPAAGELDFHDGETKKDIVVNVLNDHVRNRDERRFEVRLFDPTPGLDVVNFKGLGERTKVVVTVQDDDMNPGRLVLAEPVYELVDGKIPQVRVAVLRVDGTDGRIRFRWKTRFNEKELLLEEGETRTEVLIQPGSNRSDFELELFDVRTDLKVLNFRGLGERTTAFIRLSVNPGFLELESTAIPVIEGAGSVTVGVVRLNGSEGRVSVQWRTVALTATEDSDFVASGGELVFEEGVQQLFITVRIIDDKVRENNEQFAVELIGATTDGPGIINFRGLPRTTRAVVTITDDDINPGLLVLESNTYKVTEGVGLLRVGVVRLNGTEGRVSVQWKTETLTAKEGSDFVASGGELVFEEGVRLQFIFIRIIDDKVRETNEQFAVELIGATTDVPVLFEVLGGTRKAFVTITDDDSHAGIFGFRDTHVTLGERAGSVTLWVVRREGADGPVEMHWRTMDGTAREGLDFVSEGGKGELRFEDGEWQQSFSLQILNREGREGERAFSVGLFDPSGGASLGTDSLVTIVIQDEEDTVRVFFRDRIVQVPRGSAEVTLTVERSGGDDSRPLKVLFETMEAEGTARGDVEFRRTKGLVTFQARVFAMRVSVTLLQNEEGRRKTTSSTFFARISNPSEGEVVKERDVAVVVITPQVEDDRKETTRDEGTREQTDLEFRGIPPLKPTVDTCPAGMTMKMCAPACQGTCPGLEPVCQHLAGGCVKGCFCPPGMLLDHSLTRCVTLEQCTAAGSLLPPAGNFGAQSTGFQVQVQATRVEGTGGLSQKKEPAIDTCPAGMTMKMCAPACQGTCPGLEPVCGPTVGGCVKGCFCPPGMLLDHSLTRCVTLEQCTAGRASLLPPVGNVGGQSAGFQVQVQRQETKVDWRGGVPQQMKPVGLCPPGLTFKDCAPACQGTCPGLEHVCQHTTERCVKGCFCAPGLVLDHSLIRCVTPSQCAAGGQSRSNGLLGGLLG